ncbi:FadR/GntR family transcriptional regulator [Kibdelosporangium lantanae]|uniref:FadR/GntR family transcriptional regulator n=1 Tax=Kibdelosporangium lantanae TaxID=1497396 RepID=A0ABW3M1W5_9PSEU
MARIESNIPLAARVAEQLRERIGSGEFTVGTKLPTELELARELGVSRNSVREGVRALVHAGMLRAYIEMMHTGEPVHTWPVG